MAAFAIRMDGAREVIDLTPNISFRDVIPWEAPAGNWRLMYIVEKIADYYIDAMNPESTSEFLKLGYDPYAAAVEGKMSSQMLGIYTDEPAMHYYITGGDNPIVPWTKDMFRRFQERNGYNLRPRLPDLFFDISPDSARIRYDFYNTLTDFYSNSFYKQIHLDAGKGLGRLLNSDFFFWLDLEVAELFLSLGFLVFAKANYLRCRKPASRTRGQVAKAQRVCLT